jgi:WD40 repeat protein
MGAVTTVAFSADSRLLAASTVGENSIRLWDVESHTLMAVARGHNREVDAIAFPKGTGEMLSGGREGNLTAWNLDALVKGDALRGPFYRATYTSDGQRILAAATDGQIWTIDAKTGRRENSWSEGRKYRSVAFSEDGSVVAAIDFEGHLRTWSSNDHGLLFQVDIDDMTELATPIKPGQDFRYGNEGSFPVAVSCDGSKFALPATEADVPGIAVFDMRAGRKRFLRGKLRPANAIAFSPNGDTLIGVLLDGWKLWNLHSDSPAAEDLPGSGEPPGGAFSLDRDDPLLAVAYAFNGITLVDPRTRKGIRPLLGHSGRVWCLAFSPDNKTIVSGATDSTLRLWDVATGQLRSTLKGHLGPVLDVAFAPDGRSVVSCAADGTLRIWRTSTAE